MKLIVGLGNPGKEYEKTRHNVGFQIIDLLHEKLGFDEFKKKSKFEAFISEGLIGENKVLLAKPTTFMNLSGNAVQKIAKYYDIELEDILVVIDDLDFAIGEMKLRLKGGAGSHNGLKSLINCLNSEEFGRLRIGIESRDESQKHTYQGRDFVLGKFTKEEEKTMKDVRTKALQAIIYAVEKGINEAMNKYN